LKLRSISNTCLFPEALKQLDVDLKIGLSSTEAQRRVAQQGPNALEEKEVSPLGMFGMFFWGPMPWMIEAAALMSILVKDGCLRRPTEA